LKEQYIWFYTGFLIMEMSVLHRGFTIPVRDALWGHIYLNAGLSALTASPSFARLNRILQLGPAYCVYPGATHTRASHSLGVYHLARRLLISLCEKDGSWLSPRGALSFLCAALLHDIGHFPYTHSLKELALESHESLSAKLILAEPLKSLISKAGADPELTAAIIDKTRVYGDAETGFYRSLLSGVLDPDKLDYLNRDAWYCGVPYGFQDVDFIYSRLTPHRERGVEIDSRGIPNVESILFSKYLMYRTVYWHRQVRSATALIKKALLAGLEEGLIAPEELYDLDDQGLFSLMASHGDFPPFSLAAQVRDGQLYVESAAFPFDSGKHEPLRSLKNRKAHEEALAAEITAETGTKIGPESLIIDVSEPVTFETDLFIRDEGCTFGESSSIFKRDGVEIFIKTLQMVRIFTVFPLKVPEGVLHNLKNWVQ
jgi:HD superfamily phosphohydrolase